MYFTHRLLNNHSYWSLISRFIDGYGHFLLYKQCKKTAYLAETARRKRKLLPLSVTNNSSLTRSTTAGHVSQISSSPSAVDRDCPLFVFSERDLFVFCLNGPILDSGQYPQDLCVHLDWTRLIRMRTVLCSSTARALADLYDGTD